MYIISTVLLIQRKVWKKLSLKRFFFPTPFFLGKPREHDSSDSGTESYEGSDSLLQSWNSQSSLVDVQRVPSYESFEDDCSQSLCLNKPTMSFKDYIQERSDPVEQGKPVIPAAILAGFTGKYYNTVLFSSFFI